MRAAVIHSTGAPPTADEFDDRRVDGRRVYFASAVAPYGSIAERTLIRPHGTFAVPDGLDEGLAVTPGIAGLAAWLPLAHHAKVSGGERVLILGATGVPDSALGHAAGEGSTSWSTTCSASRSPPRSDARSRTGSSCVSAPAPAPTHDADWAVPVEVRSAAFSTMARHVLAGERSMEVERYPLENIVDAWDAQAHSPHHKLVVVP